MVLFRMRKKSSSKWTGLRPDRRGLIRLGGGVLWATHTQTDRSTVPLKWWSVMISFSVCKVKLQLPGALQHACLRHWRSGHIQSLTLLNIGYPLFRRRKVSSQCLEIIHQLSWLVSELQYIVISIGEIFNILYLCHSHSQTTRIGILTKNSYFSIKTASSQHCRSRYFYMYVMCLSVCIIFYVCVCCLAK